MARILDGKATAAEVRAEVAEGVKALEARGHPVRLDVILAEVAARADVLVVALGRREMVGAEYEKEGAVVVDVGATRETAAGWWVTCASKRWSPEHPP